MYYTPSGCCQVAAQAVTCIALHDSPRRQYILPPINIVLIRWEIYLLGVIDIQLSRSKLRGGWKAMLQSIALATTT